MANGDITKEIEYDKIEVVSTWHIQVRQATKIIEAAWTDTVKANFKTWAESQSS